MCQADRRPLDPWPLEVMTISREKPPIEVQVIVWVGLAILFAAVGVFVWFFVLSRI